MHGRKKILLHRSVVLQWVCVPFRAVVSKFFHAATRFAAQCNLTPLFQKFPVMHMKCSYVSTIENQMTKK